MPRQGCDSRIVKPPIDIVDRVVDLRNRVKWLKNVEYCLLGDETDRLNKIQAKRHDMEISNNNIRRKFQAPVEKLSDKQSKPTLPIVEDLECLDYQRNQVMQQHNQLVFIRRSLLDRLKILRDRIDHKSIISVPIKAVQDNEITLFRRVREIEDQLTSVKIINQRLKTCKQHLQCDLDLLRKELPSVRKEIEEKLYQKQMLENEYHDIVVENKRHLKAYQQLLDHTETQTRERRALHEHAMASVAEQLEDQYQVQMLAVNEMTTSLESRKFHGAPNSTTNLQQKKSNMMNSDEIMQVRCMYDQFYNIIMAGFPMDINPSGGSKVITNEIPAMLTLTNRMIEEKEQVNQQIHRIDRIMKLIEMSIDLKNDTRQKIVDRMVEQGQNFDLFSMNDTVEEQNRIIRQINDFMLILSKSLCEYIDIHSLPEIPIDFLPRLRFLSDLLSKTVNTILTEATDEDDRQTSPILRRSGVDENSQISKESRSVSSSLSSLSSSSRIKRNPMKTNIY